jgi:hypothetical protein
VEMVSDERAKVVWLLTLPPAQAPKQDHTHTLMWSLMPRVLASVCWKVTTMERTDGTDQLCYMTVASLALCSSSATCRIISLTRHAYASSEEQ